MHLYAWSSYWPISTSLRGRHHDRAKVEEDAKFDGVFVLRTNAHLSALEAMLVYKQLWTVERTFRTTKSLLETGRSITNSTKRSAATSPATARSLPCTRLLLVSWILFGRIALAACAAGICDE
jgi:hypothetical protein